MSFKKKKTHKLPDHHLSILAAAEDAGWLSSSICAKLATECLSYPREGDRRVSNAALSACLTAPSCQPCRPHYRHADCTSATTSAASLETWRGTTVFLQTVFWFFFTKYFELWKNGALTRLFIKVLPVAYFFAFNAINKFYIKLILFCFRWLAELYKCLWVHNVYCSDI